MNQSTLQKISMTISSGIRTIGLAIGLALSSLSWAGEGHDHGDAKAATSAPSTPRFTAVSDALELVGVLNGKQITLYLDRLETNAPVKEAQIELDLSGVKFVAQKHGEDEFEIVLPAEPKPGVISVTATVTIDKEVDLLAGELDIHSDLNGEGSASKNGWKKWLSWALFSAAALMALIFIRKRLQTHQANRTGGAA